MELFIHVSLRGPSCFSEIVIGASLLAASKLRYLCVFHFSIDASHNNRLGRFVNDSPQKFANTVAKTMEVDGVPHVALFALTDIPSGVELRYDYGGSCNLPWRNVRNICFYLFAAQRLCSIFSLGIGLFFVSH